MVSVWGSNGGNKTTRYGSLHNIKKEWNEQRTGREESYVVNRIFSAEGDATYPQIYGQMTYYSKIQKWKCFNLSYRVCLMDSWQTWKNKITTAPHTHSFIPYSMRTSPADWLRYEEKKFWLLINSLTTIVLTNQRRNILIGGGAIYNNRHHGEIEINDLTHQGLMIWSEERSTWVSSELWRLEQALRILHRTIENSTIKGTLCSRLEDLLTCFNDVKLYNSDKSQPWRILPANRK